jgi:molecular chaperone GrpE
MPDDGAPPDPFGGVPDERPVPPAGSAVAERLAAVEEALTALARRFDGESARAAARERVIDRQHADIERLRGDDRVGLLRPVVTDLCRLRNDLLRQSAVVPPEISAEQVAALLESYAVSVEEALLRCGVEVLPREVDTPFAPGRQQVARIVEVDDPRRDGTVAEVVQDGYAEIDGGRLVMPARVAVRRGHARPTGDTDAGGTDTGGTDTTREHVDA